MALVAVLRACNLTKSVCRLANNKIHRVPSLDNNNGGSGLGHRAGLFYCVIIAPPGVCVTP